MKLEGKNMPDSITTVHVTDQELLLSADGELPARRAAQVHAHLAACWDCRARMAETEATIADFARAHHQTLDPQLPPIAGPRALLRAQLAELAAKPQVSAWRWLFQLNSPVRVAAIVATAILVVAAIALIGKTFQHSAYRAETETTTSAAVALGSAEPNRNLTPGATRRVALSDVCSAPHEQVVGEVSTSLRQQVFQEYGITNARASDYEVDYLIAPGLGGVEDIHNLWPEPETSPTWNARVKDTLEERLHEMVCSGKVDLSTAQSDIATDWIAAYKKYFHTDRPLNLSSSLM
jgi:hypothetical protein